MQDEFYTIIQVYSQSSYSFWLKHIILICNNKTFDTLNVILIKQDKKSSLPFDGSQHRLYESVFSGNISHSNPAISGHLSHMELACSQTDLHGSIKPSVGIKCLHGGMNAEQANSCNVHGKSPGTIWESN